MTTKKTPTADQVTRKFERNFPLAEEDLKHEFSSGIHQQVTEVSEATGGTLLWTIKDDPVTGRETFIPAEKKAD